jgi:dienelactone hydrolase
MAEVVLFHHVQGLTDGVLAFAGELRAGGHTVHTPDLLFTDSSLPSYDPDATALVVLRSREFLDRAG